MKKCLAVTLCLLVALSLFLVPTKAAAAPPSADCQAISLSVLPFFPGTYFIGVATPTPTVPWMLFHGTSASPSNYMGCTFYPSGTVVSFGPYTGGFAEYVSASADQMAGCWQILSASQTSNRAIVGP